MRNQLDHSIGQEISPYVRALLGLSFFLSAAMNYTSPSPDDLMNAPVEIRLSNQRVLLKAKPYFNFMPRDFDPGFPPVDCRKDGSFIIAINLHSEKPGVFTNLSLRRIWVTNGKDTWQGEFNRDETSTHKTSSRLRAVARDCTANFRPKMDVHVIVEITFNGVTHLLRTIAIIGEAW